MTWPWKFNPMTLRLQNVLLATVQQVRVQLTIRFLALCQRLSMHGTLVTQDLRVSIQTSIYQSINIYTDRYLTDVPIPYNLKRSRGSSHLLKGANKHSAPDLHRDPAAGRTRRSEEARRPGRAASVRMSSPPLQGARVGSGFDRGSSTRSQELVEGVGVAVHTGRG